MIRRAASSFAALLLGACSSGGGAHTTPSVFVARASDFEGFHAWPSFDLGPPVAPGNDHLTGPRRVYYTELPRSGDSSFAVGTVLVKESGDGDLPSRHVFAMVKRGGGFNDTDAVYLLSGVALCGSILRS